VREGNTNLSRVGQDSFIVMTFKQKLQRDMKVNDRDVKEK
jgi:hypothetical protein